VVPDARGQKPAELRHCTLFGPKILTPSATSKAGENGLPPTGIPYLIVAGTIVVKDSRGLNVWPGQAIRFPVEVKGRFAPWA
jgi:hypothetical protein